LLVLVGICAFIAIVVGFVRVPHVLVGLTIVYFTFLPALKVFVTPLLGGTKDLISLAALFAAALVFLGSPRASQPVRLDGWAIVPIALLLVFYLANVGGSISGQTGHGIAWFHGVRLFIEPLALFVVGSQLQRPRRTLDWAVSALIAACVADALYGLIQQALGVQRLLADGYTYGDQVRQISGHLRSFGTLDEPFAYAGFLLLGVAVTLLWSRWRASIWVVFFALAAGLFVSYVRTAAVIMLGLLALAVARRGRPFFAVIFMLVALVASITAFALASQQKATRSVQLSPTTYLTLNGRTNIWRQTLPSASDWIFGRGVGATGTASQRATASLLRVGSAHTGGSVVDSGYFAVVADVGIVGLVLLLCLFGFLTRSASQAVARTHEKAGWLGLGVILVTLLDALTRESFTAFPTAYCAMLVLGLAYAVWRQRPVDGALALPAQ
jgi:hypothetical protein